MIMASPKPPVYEVKLPKEVHGHDLFDVVQTAFDPAARYSWVYRANWNPNLIRAFDESFASLDAALDIIDKDEVLAVITLADPEVGEPGDDNGFEVKLTLQGILDALHHPKLPRRVLATLVKDDFVGDLETADCILQIIAYQDIVFG